MKNPDIIHKITQGMYVLTTVGGGCVIDAVAQVSGGDYPLIAVAVMKKNYTNELMYKNNVFALSFIGTKTDPEIIKTFGFNSMRDIDKFAKAETKLESGVPTVCGTLGYLVCEKVDTIENETHTLFIGRVKDGDITALGDPMSYGYYREHKDELLKVKTESGKTAWVCTICGYVYYGDELPQGYECPICGVGPEMFEKTSN